MTTDFLNDEPPIVQVGAWEESDSGQFTVTLAGTPAETRAAPKMTVFAQEDGQLVAVEYYPAVWDEEGLTLMEVAE
jgi:hypothetical protein